MIVFLSLAGESKDVQDVSEDSDVDEIVSSSLVESYQDEPCAHSE